MRQVSKGALPILVMVVGIFLLISPSHRIKTHLSRDFYQASCRIEGFLGF